MISFFEKESVCTSLSAAVSKVCFIYISADIKQLFERSVSTDFTMCATFMTEEFDILQKKKNYFKEEKSQEKLHNFVKLFIIWVSL